MRLYEFYQDKNLINEFNKVWPEHRINEGFLTIQMLTALRDKFLNITNNISTVINLSNRKNPVNDQTLRSIYLRELQVVKEKLAKVNPKVEGRIKDFLKNHGIIIDNSSIDLSRNNLNRIAILIIVSGLLYVYLKVPENVGFNLLDAMLTGGIATIINFISNAKDSREIGQGALRVSGEVKKALNAAQQHRDSM